MQWVIDMRLKRRMNTLICSVIYIVLTNCAVFLDDNFKLLFLVAVVAIGVNIFAGFMNSDIYSKRLKYCNHGTVCLNVFRITMTVSIIFHIVYLIYDFSDIGFSYFASLINSYVLLLILFWNGIISVYLTSAQLGVKYRVIGALLGMIPIFNLICLNKIITVCNDEIEFESEKIKLNESRKDLKICCTKYPILLVHGVFFRDYKFLNYWGRVPAELIANGAKIYYGNHSSALSVEQSAVEIEKRIEEILKETGCEKVNIIAHSKGGLDSRVVINSDIGKHVASLTTINTPHGGCEFADYLLNKASSEVKNNVSSAYNFAAKKLGDKEPDFISAVSDLTHSKCEEFNQKYGNPYGVYCQSVGSVLKGASSPRFPLNLTYLFVKHFDGNHDGLVSVKAFEFGEKFTMLEPKYKRGISHADIIDLNRENIPGFDIREFYVQLVADLKNRGF